jgi:hypothetical protein
MTVRTQDGQDHKVTAVRYWPPIDRGTSNRTSDLFARTQFAILAVDLKNVPSLSLATQPPHVGEKVIGLGFREGKALTASAGVVTDVNVTLSGFVGKYNRVKFERGTKNGGLGGGNGGGPIINADGHAVCLVFMGDEANEQCAALDPLAGSGLL